MENECQKYNEILTKLDTNYEQIYKILLPFGEEIIEEENKFLLVNYLDKKINIVHPRKQFEVDCLERDCNELQEEIENIEEKRKLKNDQLNTIKSSLQSFSTTNSMAASVEFEKVEIGDN